MLRKTRKNASEESRIFRIFSRKARPAICFLNYFPRKKSTQRPPELIKFPMPAARHENKINPAMGGGGGGETSRTLILRWASCTLPAARRRTTLRRRPRQPRPPDHPNPLPPPCETGVRAAATLRPCLCFRCVRGRNGSSLGFARGRGRGLGRGTREQHHQPPEEKKEKKAEEKEKASPVVARRRRGQGTNEAVGLGDDQKSSAQIN